MPEARLPTVALLSGGMAKRMLPATLLTAKSMLDVAGEPFLGHQLRMLAAQGAYEIVICCGHFEEQIRAYAADGAQWGCAIRYSSDGARPLGTGGALRQALPMLGTAFMVMYGDSYLRTPLRPVWDAFLASGSDGLMTVYENAGQWDRSNVLYANDAIERYDKQGRTPGMRHIDYGLSCFKARCLQGYAPGEAFDLADHAAMLLGRGQLAGYEVAERFYEIGSPAGLAEITEMLQAQAAGGQP